LQPPTSPSVTTYSDQFRRGVVTSLSQTNLRLGSTSIDEISRWNAMLRNQDWFSILLELVQDLRGLAL
jgi:hypothetical protein